MLRANQLWQFYLISLLVSAITSVAVFGATDPNNPTKTQDETTAKFSVRFVSSFSTLKDLGVRPWFGARGSRFYYWRRRA
jgi:hypothetical protein